jgi:hypothetical protein
MVEGRVRRELVGADITERALVGSALDLGLDRRASEPEAARA